MYRALTAGLLIALGLTANPLSVSLVLADEDEAPTTTLSLNGEATHVQWSDGDSFRILDGQYADHSVRLGGYNALEHYGPVHRWGEWTSEELYQIAVQATEFARAGTWACTTSGQTDHYNRLLVTCDGLTTAIVAAGLGHLFAIDTPAGTDAIAAQAAAQRLHLGMWAKGVPATIVTSLHSAAEGGDRTYNRVISTVDGSSSEVVHDETYELCQEVCVGESCLLYIPFDQRYGDSRAACLQTDSTSTQELPHKLSAGPESAMHATFGPQRAGEYSRYAPTCRGPNLTHLTNSGLDVILSGSSQGEP